MSTQVAVGPKMARRAIVLLVGKLSAIALSILAAFIIPRQLGPRGMGFYSYFYSSVFTMICVLDAGGSMLLRRYVPELLASGRRQVRPLFLASLRAKLMVLAVFVAALPLTQDPRMYALALLAALATSLVDSAQTVLYTGGALVAYASVTAVLTAARILLLILLTPLFQRLGISLALVISSAISLLLFLPRALRLLPPSQDKLSQSYWRFLRFGLTSYAADLAFVLGNRLALILGRHMIDDMAELGYLGVAFMVFLLGRQLAFFIGETSLPTLVHYHTSRQPAQFTRTMYHVWRYTNIVVFLGSALILCYAEPVVRFVAGDAFAEAALLIKLLVPALAATTLTLCVRIASFVRERSLRLLASHGGALLAFCVGMGIVWVFRPGSVSGVTIALMFSGSAVLGLAIMAFNASVQIPARRLLLSTLKPAAAAGIVWYAVCSLHPHGARLALSAPLAVLAYLSILLMVKGLEYRDWHRLLALMGRKPNSVQNWTD